MLKAICSAIKWETLKSPQTTTIKIISKSQEEVVKALEETFKDKLVKIGSVVFFDDILSEKIYYTDPIPEDELDKLLIDVISVASEEKKDAIG